MSFLSDIAGIAGNVVGWLPFPGANTLGKVLTTAGSVGSTLGAQQAGKAKGAADQATIQQAQDRNALTGYNDAQNAQFQAGNQDLQRQQFATNNRGQTAQQALIGALLSGGYKPTSIGGITPASGGLLNALNSNPAALASMKTLGSQASTAQNTPLSFTGGNILTPPTLTPLPDMGTSNSFLSNIANIAQLAGAAVPKKKPLSAGPPVLPSDENLE